MGGALACTLAALLIGGGEPGRQLEMTVQDDALLLHRPAPQVRATARMLAELGADRVRITAGWSDIAPNPQARRRPGRPFVADDPRTYPQTGWRRLDTAVRAARDAGLEVQIDLAFWAPRWAVARATTSRLRHRHRDYPDPGEFAAFATAAARRYSGTFPDPMRRGRALPAVRMWTTWNEPNHPSFLQPQWIPRGARLAGGRARRGAARLRTRRPGRMRWRPGSPHVYRSMHAKAYDALKAVSPHNLVLMGGTASTGSSRPGRGGVPPLRFLRELACVDRALRPLRVPECRDFTPLRADGWAHHPYTRRTAPDTPARRRDDAALADTERLAGLLGDLHERGRIARRLEVFHTEFGYESNPPDPFAPFSAAEQARHLAHASYLAWREPHTRMFGQFLLRDIDPRESGRRPGTRGHWRDWQTGLLRADGTPKEALQAFRLPFWAEPRRQGTDLAVVVWGQVRPGDGRQTVRVERRDPRTGTWVGVPTFGEATCRRGQPEFLTDPAGAFLRIAPFEADGEYRFTWRRPEGDWEGSVPVGPLPAPV